MAKEKKEREQEATAGLKKISSEHAKELEKLDREFERVARKHPRLKEKRLKASETLDFFAEGTNFGKYPTGMREIKISETVVEYDELWPETEKGTYKYELIIPRGTTLRGGITLAHWAFCGLRARFEKGCMDKQYDKSLVASRKARLEEAYTNYAVAHNTEIGSNLDLEPTVKTPLPPKLLETACESAYKTIIVKLQKEAEQQKAKAEEQEEKREKAEEEVLNADPSVLIDDYVDGRARKIAKAELKAQNEKSGNAEAAAAAASASDDEALDAASSEDGEEELEEKKKKLMEALAKQKKGEKSEEEKKAAKEDKKKRRKEAKEKKRKEILEKKKKEREQAQKDKGKGKGKDADPKSGKGDKGGKGKGKGKWSKNGDTPGGAQGYKLWKGAHKGKGKGKAKGKKGGTKGGKPGATRNGW